MVNLLLCDSCDQGYHTYCLEPVLKSVPDRDWYCDRCLVGTGDYGFADGEIYSLRQFQEKANNFKDRHFSKMPFDPVLNKPRPVTEDDVEREFWRLVESVHETVEVEYGADIHSTTHGSGFPTIEKMPLNHYSTDPWNLNNLPLHPDSLFRHIKSDVSGMTVPWLYVGMCFSTFCWHNEDHYTYSMNYQHFGATKTWYGIPGSDAVKFENAMREAVPELFEQQPDLLFQLVTLLTPQHLMKAGVKVFALDQRAGQFVVTFPQAYHAGFNHGVSYFSLWPIRNRDRANLIGISSISTRLLILLRQIGSRLDRRGSRDISSFGRRRFSPMMNYFSRLPSGILVSKHATGLLTPGSGLVGIFTDVFFFHSS